MLAKKKRKTPKSKHKHIYEKCIIESEDLLIPSIGLRCKRCGKIRILDILPSEKCADGSGYMMLTADEIYEKYKELKIVKAYKLF